MRKRRRDPKDVVRTGVSFDREIIDELDKLAAKLNRDRSHLVNTMIKLGLERYKEDFEE